MHSEECLVPQYLRVWSFKRSLASLQQFSSISQCSSAFEGKSALWQHQHHQEALKMPILRARLLFGPISNYLFEFPPGAGVAVLGPVISVAGKALPCA